MLYKKWIKRRILSNKRKHPDRTLKYYSNLLKVEPSYLSRFLNQSSTHLSDPLLYRLLRTLDLSESEIDYVFLLKEWERTPHPDRKNYLKKRLQDFQITYKLEGLKKLKTHVGELLQLLEQVNS